MPGGEGGIEGTMIRIQRRLMNGLVIIGFLVFYFLLTWVILPKLGVPT